MLSTYEGHERMTLDKLFERGRLEYLSRFDEAARKRLVGATPTLAVVTRADFIAHPALCLLALESRASIYILGSDGSFEALLCRHRYT